MCDFLHICDRAFRKQEFDSSKDNDSWEKLRLLELSSFVSHLFGLVFPRATFPKEGLDHAVNRLFDSV